MGVKMVFTDPQDGSNIPGGVNGRAPITSGVHQFSVYAPTR
jgi:hypothetical protein